MFGTTQYGKLLYGTGLGILGTPFNWDLSYNGFNFSDSDICIYNTPDLDNLWEISNAKYKTARQDGMWYIVQTIDTKTLTIEGSIRSSSTEWLENKMGLIKQKLYEPNKSLLIKRASGSIWETTASCVDLTFDRQQYTIDWIQFRVTFEIIDPFFYWQLLSEVSFLWKTASFIDSVENLVGERKAFPTVRVQFGSSISGSTIITLSLNGTTISVPWTFTDGDIVVIDMKEKDVLVNSIWEQEFTGGFAPLEVGVNQIEVTINGTWEVDVYVWRYPTYG